MADFISESEFTEKLGDGKDATVRWNELTIHTIYKITKVLSVTTKYGPATILLISTREGDSKKVWAPQSLAYRLKGANLPAFVRPLGLKPHDKDLNMQYHAYDLVFPRPQ